MTGIDVKHITNISPFVQSIGLQSHTTGEKSMKQEIGFTIKTLNALPLPEGKKRAYVYDAKESGLLIQITSTGRKTFQFYKWHEGKPLRVTIGLYPDMSIE